MTNPAASARALLQAGRIEEADRASLDILARDPRNADAHLVHGWACVLRGKLDEARRAIDAALTLAPGHPGAGLLRAEMLQAGGDIAAARAELIRVLATFLSLPPEASALLRGIFAILATAPLSKWQPLLPVFSKLGYLLAASRPTPDPAWIDDAAAAPILAAGGDFTTRIAGFCALLGFSRESGVAWNREIFERVFLRWMLEALDTERLAQAFELEQIVYEIHVKQLESEEHFARSVARWKDAMRAAGARFAARLPRTPRAAPQALARVAFFIENITGLAHVQMTLDLIEGNASLPAPRFAPHVFCLNGEPEAIRRMRDTGVSVEILCPSSSRAELVPALATLQRRLAEIGADALVWVSLVVTMPFAFAMRLAPAQIWWAMKYHSLDMPEIDGYLTSGGLEGGTKSIGGRTWLAAPVASRQWTAPGKAAEAAAVRSALGPARVVFGSFGREEKLDSAPFLDAVARILRAVPDSLFLWTGRGRHPGIQRHLESAGVAGRCRFIGWVDTKLYAQVIDVFLDSFPFPCGFTLYEAAAAGKPAVLFSSAASADTGANALIGPLLDQGDPARDAARLARSIFHSGGEDLSLRTRSAEDYVAVAVRAGTDEGFRKRAGEAYRRFVESFLADRARAAQIYAGHFDAVIAAARARGAAG
jgi:glycosyltransferase involved in cell wall biosynthesis